MQQQTAYLGLKILFSRRAGSDVAIKYGTHTSRSLQRPGGFSFLGGQTSHAVETKPIFRGVNKSVAS